MVVVLAAVLAACRPAGEPFPALLVTPAPAQQPAAAPLETDRWAELLARVPVPYQTPLPPADWTAIDGAYVKLDPRAESHVHCRRCPDYLPEGGIWRASFDRGVFRILSEGVGWRNLASYSVEGDQLTLFNDPVCPQELGTYRWRLEEGALRISLVADPCAIGLRAANLTDMAWSSCQPPNQEAAVSDHWPRPAGCW